MGEAAKTVTKSAEYVCTTKLPYREEEVIMRSVSVSLVEGEDPAVTLAKAAKDLEKTILGCTNVTFKRFLPAEKEVAQRSACP